MSRNCQDCKDWSVQLGWLLSRRVRYWLYTFGLFKTFRAFPKLSWYFQMTKNCSKYSGYFWLISKLSREFQNCVKKSIFTHFVDICNDWRCDCKSNFGLVLIKHFMCALCLESAKWKVLFLGFWNILSLSMKRTKENMSTPVVDFMSTPCSWNDVIIKLSCPPYSLEDRSKTKMPFPKRK